MLHRLPTPRAGEVLGLVGSNGVGKSTALKILAGNLQPNIGKFERPPVWKDILKFFRGSELQNYFTNLLENNLKALIKVQYIDSILKDNPKLSEIIVGKKLQAIDKKGRLNEVIEGLDLQSLMEREVGQLSGGELQRFSIALICLQEANIFMFDEPTSYLDIKQRLKAAKMIRSLLNPDVYVIAVDHDMTIIDYLSDIVCVFYGLPGAYGVVTLPYSVKEGINIYLAGEIPTANIRFRDDEISIKVTEHLQQRDAAATYKYPAMVKTLG